MRRGFTLIENLLAIFLLAMGVATTAYMIPVATRGLSQSKITTQAAFFAQQRMEEAMAEPGTPATTVDPDVPELTGEIDRVPYNFGLTHLKVLVYRTDDPLHHPIVELECL